MLYVKLAPYCNINNLTTDRSAPGYSLAIIPVHKPHQLIPHTMKNLRKFILVW